MVKTSANREGAKTRRDRKGNLMNLYTGDMDTLSNPWHFLCTFAPLR